MDANVLIDYRDSNISILTLASHHLGRIQVIETVLDEVDGLDSAQCERLGIAVVEPDLPQLIEAATKRGPLSTQDHLCLIVAKADGSTCITNDAALRKACNEHGVPVLWGLQLMTELVRLVQLSAEDAVAVARDIHANNPLHIPSRLVERFATMVRSIEAAAEESV